MEMISLRVDADKLDTLGKILRQNRSETIRELVDEGRKMKALDLYKLKKVSLGLAARIAGLNLSAFIDLMKEYNVYLNLDEDDVRDALRNAERAGL